MGNKKNQTQFSSSSSIPLRQHSDDQTSKQRPTTDKIEDKYQKDKIDRHTGGHKTESQKMEMTKLRLEPLTSINHILYIPLHQSNNLEVIAHN